MNKTLIALVTLISVLGCTKKNEKPTVWIYTSLYKDTITDVQPQLEKAFPEVNIQFYQAGSEEVASKVQAENLAGQIQADILISSDRFWYEDMATQNKLAAYKTAAQDKINPLFKHPQDYYSTLSYPVMVIAYNSEAVPEAEAPKTFKELAESKWKDKVSVSSPLASGTSFTSVAFLVGKYGWDYFSGLRKNNLIAEGGNSGVIRRLQSKERPVGIVLMENVLRLAKSDTRIKFVIPQDGAIVQSNVFALVKKDNESQTKKDSIREITEWFFSEPGQRAMTKSFMYSSTTNLKPEGSPDFSEILKTAKPWSREFISTTMKDREKIKDQFSKIVF